MLESIENIYERNKSGESKATKNLRSEQPAKSEAAGTSRGVGTETVAVAGWQRSQRGKMGLDQRHSKHYLM